MCCRLFALCVIKCKRFTFSSRLLHLLMLDFIRQPELVLEGLTLLGNVHFIFHFNFFLLL